jgi:hypothetical protein
MFSSKAKAGVHEKMEVDTNLGCIGRAPAACAAGSGLPLKLFADGKK